jgi:hypothetical protein
VQTGSAEFLIAHAIRRQRRNMGRVSGMSLFESVLTLWPYLRKGRFTNVGDPPCISASAL